MPQNLSKRKSIRLKYYDYSQAGYYFITICTYRKECILCRITSNSTNVGVALHGDPRNNNAKHVGAGLVSARIKLTHIGKITEKIYLNLENEFANIKLHDYVIMPNHIHMIIEICKRADTRPAPTIGNIISSFKSKITTCIIKEVKKGKIKPFNKKLWQRNYYEHIIRNETEHIMIKQYIINNPCNWENDKYY